MRVGFIANRLLAANPTGTVLAAFERSAYLNLADGIVCLADVELPEGPLMVPCSRAGTLQIGTLFTPLFDSTSVWRPSQLQGWTITALKRRLMAIGASHDLRDLFDTLPASVEGDLSTWLAQSLSRESVVVPKAVNRLIGLGPGLTPSGDDFLGGMMVAMGALDRRDLSSALFASLDLSRTNRISIAHLKAAHEGAAAAPLHHALNGVLSGPIETLPALLAGLHLMGHSSGWDAFAGCCVVLRTYCATEETKARSFNRRRQ
jgi:hypothetical protein